MSLDREVTPEQLREAIARVKFWHGFSGAPPESYEAYPADIIALIQAAERGMEYERRARNLHHALSFVLADHLGGQSRGRTTAGHVDEDGCWCCSCHTPDNGAAHWSWCESKRENVRAARAALNQSADVPCPKCGQREVGQYGEYPCSACDLPTLHGDREALASDPPQGKEEER